MHNIHSTNFDLQDALFLARISELVYQEEATIKAVLGDAFPNFAFIDIHKSSGYDTEAIVLGNHEVVVVAFRGTEAESIQDWIGNLDNRFFPVFIGAVHQGFWQALDQIWRHIVVTIKEFQNKNQIIYFTGHSQGGALAMLAAKRYFDEQNQKSTVYTFGQPKIGDILFATNFSATLPERIFRVFNEGDTIIDSPPKYFHTGTPVKLHSEGGFEINNDANILETGKGSFAELLDSIFDYATNGLPVHQIEEYLRRLENC